MLFGFGGTLVCLVVEAALLASFASPVPAVPNRAALKSCVALLYVLITFKDSNFTDLPTSYIFIFVYGCGVDVAGFTFFGEVYPNHLRAKGLAISVVAQSLTALVYSTGCRNCFLKHWMEILPSNAPTLSLFQTNHPKNELLISNKTGLHRLRVSQCRYDCHFHPRNQGRTLGGGRNDIW